MRHSAQIRLINPHPPHFLSNPMTPKRPGTEVQGRPALDVELPVTVQEDLCRAQFNKKKRWAGSFVHSQQRPPWAGYPHPWVPTTSVRLTKIVSFSSLQQSAVSLKPQPKRQWNTAKRDVFFLTLMEVGVHVHCVSCPRKANSLSPRNFAWERTTAFLSHCEDFFFSRQLAIFFSKFSHFRPNVLENRGASESTMPCTCTFLFVASAGFLSSPSPLEADWHASMSGRDPCHHKDSFFLPASILRVTTADHLSARRIVVSVVMGMYSSLLAQHRKVLFQNEEKDCMEEIKSFLFQYTYLPSCDNFVLQNDL